MTYYIAQYLSPDEKETWEAFKNNLQLDVPKPETIKRNSKKLIDKISLQLIGYQCIDWSSITIDQFISAICANNYEELIDKDHIKSTYEIYVAVSAITVNNIGVDYYEIAPGKSFTND